MPSSDRSLTRSNSASPCEKSSNDNANATIGTVLSGSPSDTLNGIVAGIAPGRLKSGRMMREKTRTTSFLRKASGAMVITSRYRGTELSNL